MKPNRQPIHGILLLDKPAGLSSNQALQKARNIIGAAKAGHTGSLDPMATGLLPICFGEASKFAQFGLNASKAYEAVMKLGVATTTADAEGEIIEQHPVPEISHDELGRVQYHFQGAHQQVPPMYSALKQNGVPLYQLARKGEVVDRSARAIMIHQLTLQKLAHDQVHLTVSCSKGTYVRTLAEDIAKSLGCAAHLISLRRTQVGNLQGPMHTLETLVEAGHNQQSWQNFLLPIDALLVDLPSLHLEKDSCQALLQGKKVFCAEEMSEKNHVRLYTSEGKFFGVGSVDSACYLKSERLVSSDYLHELTK